MAETPEGYISSPWLPLSDTIREWLSASPYDVFTPDRALKKKATLLAHQSFIRDQATQGYLSVSAVSVESDKIVLIPSVEWSQLTVDLATGDAELHVHGLPKSIYRRLLFHKEQIVETTPHFQHRLGVIWWEKDKYHQDMLEESVEWLKEKSRMQLPPRKRVDITDNFIHGMPAVSSAEAETALSETDGNSGIGEPKGHGEGELQKVCLAVYEKLIMRPKSGLMAVFARAYGELYPDRPPLQPKSQAVLDAVSNHVKDELNGREFKPSTRDRLYKEIHKAGGPNFIRTRK